MGGSGKFETTFELAWLDGDWIMAYRTSRIVPSFHSDERLVGGSAAVKGTAWAIAHFHEAFLAVASVGAMGLLFFGAYYR